MGRPESKVTTGISTTRCQRNNPPPMLDMSFASQHRVPDAVLPRPCSTENDTTAIKITQLKSQGFKPLCALMAWVQAVVLAALQWVHIAYTGCIQDVAAARACTQATAAAACHTAL